MPPKLFFVYKSYGSVSFTLLGYNKKSRAGILPSMTTKIGVTTNPGAETPISRGFPIPGLLTKSCITIPGVKIIPGSFYMFINRMNKFML